MMEVALIIVTLFLIAMFEMETGRKVQEVARELEYTNSMPLIRLRLYHTPASTKAHLTLQNPSQDEAAIVTHIQHWNRSCYCGGYGGLWFATEANDFIAAQGDAVNGTLLARNTWMTIGPEEEETIMSYETESPHNMQLFLTYASSIRAWVHGSILRRSGKLGHGAYVQFSHEVRLPSAMTRIPAALDPMCCVAQE